MVRDEHLDFWIRHNYNVLFVGEHGVGKTSIVKAAFDRNRLDWRYFSAATMDPWVDLVGVPKERVGSDGQPYLDLLRLPGIDQAEALFFDELNRSHKKVRNAVMEMIQFRTINGKPFPRLRLIWAAINPDDEETYDVERLDPAQADRFHIKVTVPYQPDLAYFTGRYGEHVAQAAVDWWNELPDNVKKEVSPRRLDYALDNHRNGGDIRFVLPPGCNVSRLLTMLRHGSIDRLLDRMLDGECEEEATQFLLEENNYTASLPHITRDARRMRFFLPLVPDEKLGTLVSDGDVRRFLLQHAGSHPRFGQALARTIEANTDRAAVRAIRKAAEDSGDVARAIGKKAVRRSKSSFRLGTSPEPPYAGSDYRTNADYIILLTRESTSIDSACQTTAIRRRKYENILDAMPRKLSPEAAKATLRFLNRLVQRSTFDTFARLTYVMGVVNSCILALSNGRRRSFEQIKEATADCLDLWECIMTDEQLCARLLLPEVQEAA